MAKPIESGCWPNEKACVDWKIKNNWRLVTDDKGLTTMNAYTNVETPFKFTKESVLEVDFEV